MCMEWIEPRAISDSCSQVCIVHKIVSCEYYLFNFNMGPFYVEWVEPRAVISAVKCALYIKLSFLCMHTGHKPPSCYLGDSHKKDPYINGGVSPVSRESYYGSFFMYRVPGAFLSDGVQLLSMY